MPNPVCAVCKQEIRDVEDRYMYPDHHKNRSDCVAAVVRWCLGVCDEATWAANVMIAIRAKYPEAQEKP